MVLIIVLWSIWALVPGTNRTCNDILLDVVCGHQNLCWARVRLTPGRHERTEAWAHWMTADLKAAVTNSLLARQPSGMGTWSMPCFTWSSISHCTAPRRQESASSFVFLDTGLKDSWKLNLLKNKAPRTWREFKPLAVCRYSKFLWSVQTKNGCSVPSNPMPPLLQSYLYCQEFSISHIVIPFRWG